MNWQNPRVLFFAGALVVLCLVIYFFFFRTSSPKKGVQINQVPEVFSYEKDSSPRSQVESHSDEESFEELHSEDDDYLV